MTPAQIRALRVDIRSVDLRHVVFANICDQKDRHLTHVTVQLEPL